MSWWPWSEKAGEASISRSNMRDAMRRLRCILLRSGMMEEDTEMGQTSTGDPFQDKVNWFTRQVQNLSEQIAERNTNQRESMGSAADLASDSHEINKQLRDLRHDLHQIKELIEVDEEKLRKARKKDKPEDVIHSLEHLLEERSTSYQNCHKALEALRELDGQRMMSEKEADKHGTDGASGPRTFRTSIERLKQRRRNHHINLSGVAGAADAGDVGGGGKSALATNTETAEEYKALREKQRQQDASLAQLGNVLGEITQGAKKIGEELAKQNSMMDNTSGTVDRLSDNLSKINNNLNDLLKKQSPLSMTLYVVACLLILAICGFFLFEFGAV